MSSKTTRQPQFRPKLRNRKSKGEWAEIVFVAKAMALGLTVCKPYGENHRFDFLVHAPRNQVARVQVKSSWTCNTKNGYQFKTSGCGRRYRAGEVDFIVAYVVPEDAWYVIPVREVRKRYQGTVFPHITGSRSKFEKFREAWHLLQRPRRRRGEVLATLHACADPAFLATGGDIAEEEMRAESENLAVCLSA
ncbi:MAG TPA: group I intron-associated PD-(D/E)XK endonuclease [Terriglobales bacterium]|nr:group I intron-associated PD-(D/E)XK endonuclease [Terriglobales bacterium]